MNEEGGEQGVTLPGELDIDALTQEVGENGRRLAVPPPPPAPTGAAEREPRASNADEEDLPDPGEVIVSELPSLLRGFEADAANRTLRFGDCISLIPNGLNGCVAFADNQRGWVSLLHPDVSVPPNLRDCRFQLLPRKQFAEVKQVNKILRAGLWDGGQGLPVPQLPAEASLPAIEKLAEDFARRNKCPDVKLVRQLFKALHAAKEEREENETEGERQSGRAEISYGDYVQLLHVSTGTTVSVAKAQALERGEKKVEFLPDDGNDKSIFEVLPAFKTLSMGQPVISGDLVVFQTMKKIEGQRLCLHMSNLSIQSQDESRRRSSLGGHVHSRDAVLAGLRCDSEYIVHGEEFNASSRPTFWRALSFSAYATSGRGGGGKSDVLKCEDFVGLYHKDAEAYLFYDEGIGPQPQFMVSQRVSNKMRKKSSWIWKVENDTMLNAGEPVVCGDQKFFRIKHLATNKYLCGAGSSLEMTEDYHKPETLFTFRSFARFADATHRDTVQMGGLAYIRSASGTWLTQISGRGNIGRRGSTSEAVDLERLKPVKLSHQDFPSERDALLMLSVRNVDVQAAVQMRRALVTLRDYKTKLDALPMPPAALPDKLGENVDEATQKVLTIVAKSYDSVYPTVEKLLLACTTGSEDQDPLTREGAPNKTMQKLLREMGVPELVVALLRKPFDLGISLEWMGDPRMRKVRDISRIFYRLLKQAAKQNEKNAEPLLRHMPLFRSHLNKELSCTATIREIYEGKRRLLSQVQEDQVHQYCQLLLVNKDPRFIVFLRAICASDGQPIPNNQAYVCKHLLDENASLLPKITTSLKLDGSGTLSASLLHTQNGVTLTQTVNCGDFSKTVPKNGIQYERADLILGDAVDRLKEDEKTFRYFLRCLYLYSELMRGRNQAAIGFLVKNEDMCMGYHSIITIMGSPSMPMVLRARYVELMVRLWVDRDPQSSKPQVAYTRAWARALANVSQDQMQNSELGVMKTSEEQKILPVCETEFKELIELLLRELPKFGARGKEEGKGYAIGPHSSPGLIEYAEEMIICADQMMDFGLMVQNRDSTAADYTRVRHIYAALFSLLDVRKDKTGAAPSVALNRLRERALDLMWRVTNMRANHRISLAVECWERMYDKMETAPGGIDKLTSAQVLSGTDGGKAALEMYHPYINQMRELAVAMFERNYVSPDDIGSDVVPESYMGQEKPDPTLEVLLALLRTGSPAVNVNSMRCLFRHLLQKTRCLMELKRVQLLAFPSAVKMYTGTEVAIRRLTALKKHIYADKQEAYDATTELMVSLTAYITPSETMSAAAVANNQRIILNRELDEPVVNLLGLDLVRDSSRRMRGELAMDRAKNERRRDLFQTFYDFLQALVRNFRAAQEKLYPLISIFVDHVGVEKLNVVDFISEVFRNNPSLMLQVKQGFLQQFIDFIVEYGRKARWLKFFEAFVEANGQPVKRTQDLVLSLLMEEKEAVLDLTCDYTESAFLAPDDPRYGKKRIDLMRDKEQKAKYASLLKYHCCSLDLLAMCSTGKNAGAKALTLGIVSVNMVVNNILDLTLDQSVKSEASDLDPDTVHFVRRPWTRILTDVHLSSTDHSSMRQLLSSKRIFGHEHKKEGDAAAPASLDPNKPASYASPKSLLSEFSQTLQLLTERLKAAKGTVQSEQGFQGRDDGRGSDMSCHVEYAFEILRALELLFQRKDLYQQVREKPDVLATSTELRAAIRVLSAELDDFGIERMLLLCQSVDASMESWQIPGEQLVLKDDQHGELAAATSREETFKRGWTDFCTHFTCVTMDVPTADPRLLWMKSTSKLAMLFGSSSTPYNSNHESLKGLITQLCDKRCDSFVRVMGLRTVRAILYLQPDNPSYGKSQREVETKRFMDNEPPISSIGASPDPEFVKLQVKVASLGALNAVLHNLDASQPSFQPDSDAVLASLRLCVTLLEGGNNVVQDKLAALLEQASSQGFFQLLRTLLEQSVEMVKEQKRKEKQAQAEKEAMNKTGMTKRRSSLAMQKAADEEVPDEGKSAHTFSLEVVKVMRRMCLGQHSRLQDILRRQRLNRESVDLFQHYIKYLAAIEPGTKLAIDTGDVVLPQAILRGFMMLGEAMQGPNRQNQQSISTTGIFDLADLVMAKIKLIDINESGGLADFLDSLNQGPKGLMSFAAKTSSKASFNQVVPFAGSEADVKARKKMKEQNELRCQLKKAVLSCLLAFLEGVQGEDIPKQMLLTVNWGVMMVNMVTCYKYRYSSDVVNTKALEEEGIRYFFLMKFLSNFDESHEIIDPIFKEHPQAVAYFSQRTGYIEIARDGNLERVYFRLPDSCLPFGALDRQFPEMFEAERDEQDRKNQQYLDNMMAVVESELFLSRIRKTVLAFTASHWGSIRSTTFCIALLIHFVLVFGGYMTSDAYAEFKERVENQDPSLTSHDIYFFEEINPYTIEIARWLSVFYLVCCIVRLFAFAVAQAPLLVISNKMGAVNQEEEAESELPGESSKEEEENPLDNPFYKPKNPALTLGLPEEEEDEKDDSNFLPPPISEEQKTSIKSKILLFLQALREVQTLYEVFFFLFAILAVALDQPLFTVYGLFEICFWRGSRTAIDAIRFNLIKMMQTMLLGLLAMYLWMVMGMSTIRSLHTANTCTNMFQCFCSYIFTAIRGDGVKDVLDDDFVFPGTVAEAFVGEGVFVWRLIWDITYWLLFVLILIAIISGIIIDAFGSMRDQADADAADIRSTCFVCNLDRFQLDQHGIGFDKHVASEHNPRWYLFFLLYLRQKPATELTGQEAYVKNCVWPNRDYTWFPRENTMTLKVETEDNEIKELAGRLQGLEDNVTQRFDALEGHLAKILQVVSGDVGRAPSTEFARRFSNSTTGV